MEPDHRYGKGNRNLGYSGYCDCCPADLSGDQTDSGNQSDAAGKGIDFAAAVIFCSIQFKYENGAIHHAECSGNWCAGVGHRLSAGAAQDA